MVRQRAAVGNQAKKRLRAQAGGKCANPGCPAVRTHVHHIRSWAVYETNDERHLIAVCPICHDAIHHGTLVITDETVYAWKAIERADETQRAHVYVEPSAGVKLLLGSLAIATMEEIIVFDLGESNSLRFRIVDGEILLVDAQVRSLDGQEVLRVRDNYVRSMLHPSTRFDQTPGHVVLTALDLPTFIPLWMVQVMRQREPRFGADGTAPVFDLEVVKPGMVGIQGIWVDNDTAVIATHASLNFIRAGLGRPVSLVGHGENTVLRWRGPIGKAMFGFERSDGAPTGASAANSRPV